MLRSGRELRVKLGFDPTGPKIHLGRAVILRKLRAFQELGHQVVFIVGDFTALIGDPSDKLGKRPMLTPAEVEKNLKDYKRQVGAIIDLRRAEFHYNSKWLKKLAFREIVSLAESFSVQQMLARRNFKERWDKQEEISLRELLYPLMQGYDSVAVKSDVEIGGFDQLFNLKAGRIIQKYHGLPEQDILATVMLEGLDGRKMSTSWGNVVNIEDFPGDMFGKLMSIKDEFTEKYFQACADVAESEIPAILSAGPREAKLRLAFAIVKLYHGEKKAASARDEFIRVFREKRNPDVMPDLSVGMSKIALIDLVLKTGVAGSRSEARRLVEQGGVRVNSEKKTDPDETIQIENKSVLHVGKKHFFRLLI